MKLKFLGTGTSQGVPILGCTHPVCLSDDPRDKRLRSSALLTTDNNHKILIDCGPDFRQQMFANNESNVDSVLLTHEHNDHVIGLDDMRPIIFHNKKDMPIYCLPRVINEIKERFPYAFGENKYPGAPSFDFHPISRNEAFKVLDQEIIPINIIHGELPILGFRINNLAYITDAHTIPKEEKEKLKGLDVLIINALRKEEEHNTHLILPQAIELSQELKPKKTYITHMSYKIGFHEETEKSLPKDVHLAFDGLEIYF